MLAELEVGQDLRDRNVIPRALVARRAAVVRPVADALGVVAVEEAHDFGYGGAGYRGWHPLLGGQWGDASCRVVVGARSCYSRSKTVLIGVEEGTDVGIVGASSQARLGREGRIVDVVPRVSALVQVIAWREIERVKLGVVHTPCQTRRLRANMPETQRCPVDEAVPVLLEVGCPRVYVGREVKRDVFE